MTNEDSKHIPYFRFGIRGSSDAAIELLEKHPMEARNIRIETAQVNAVNCLLSNITNGRKLKIRNFSRINAKEVGFSREVFLAVLDNLQNHSLLHRDGTSYSSSFITYFPSIMKFIPKHIVNYPRGPIIINIKEEDTRGVAKVDTKERKELKHRLTTIWGFYLLHRIDPGLTTDEFNIINQCETIVYGRPSLVKPKQSDVLPYIIYNDRDLTKGGRMYGAFWINETKIFRRAITIDGELTSDIDGKGMHVQLLYKLEGEHFPDGEMYIYTDHRRKITKRLMLLMMNTAEEYTLQTGRKRVMRTYKKHYGTEQNLEEYIRELEGFHYKISKHLYKPNWGNLQKTEAAIMLNIMEAGMNEGIVILPVHDGCLCQRKHRDRVLQFFSDQGIKAEEHMEHLKPIPFAEYEELVKSHNKLKLAV